MSTRLRRVLHRAPWLCALLLGAGLAAVGASVWTVLIAVALVGFFGPIIIHSTKEDRVGDE